MAKKTPLTRDRSAVTGRYVTPGYAKAHPNTTVKEATGVAKKGKNNG